MRELPETRGSLLLRLRDADDTGAWQQFLDLYGPAVFGYFRRRGLQEADAVDLCQEVFRRVVSAIGLLDYNRDQGRFRSWLFTIASRELSRFAERNRRRITNFETTLFRELPSPEEDESLWTLSIRRRLFEIALEQVKPHFSEKTLLAFQRTAVEGHDGDAVAKELNLSRAAVYMAKARVLARLREVVALL